MDGVDEESPIVTAMHALPLSYDDTVNLDVSTMIVLVSEMTNSNQHASPLGAFKDRVLRDMCLKEHDSPVLPILLPQLEGKIFVACSVAVASFQKIVFTMGGATERERVRLFELTNPDLLHPGHSFFCMCVFYCRFQPHLQPRHEMSAIIADSFVDVGD